MDFTLLHHKPIVYGSPVWNAAFWLLIVLHIVPATIAPVSAIVAFASQKGGRLHVQAGKFFVRSMVAAALTGIALVLIRLSFFYVENHTKYAGLAMPSTIPARLAFLLDGFWVLYLARVATPPRVFKRPAGSLAWFDRVAPLLLAGAGIALTALIIIRFNPWTGALWNIWTVSGLALLAARTGQGDGRDAAVARHRFGMTFLAAFSMWGALQGFGPAIGTALQGPEMSTTPYRGDQPGPFNPSFGFFLVGWAPVFVAGGFVVRAFARRARQRRVSPTTQRAS
jgi:hypothetical protein